MMAAYFRQGRRALAVLAVSGVLSGLCLVFPVLGALQWVALAPALAVLITLGGDAAVRLRRIYVYGLVFFYAFSLVIFHWFVYMYPLEFTGMHPIAALGVVLLAWLGLSALQSAFGALIFVAFAYLSRRGLLRRYPLLGIPTLATLWCVREWSQTLIWSGVPWGRLAIGQSASSAMMGSAAVLGSYGITLALVAVNAALAYALLLVPYRRLCALVGVSVFALHTALGLASVTVTDAMLSDRAEAHETIRVAAIQGNIGSLDKWSMSAAESYEVYFEMTEQAASEGASIILWPETAVPTFLEDSPSHLDELCTLARQSNVVLLLGYYIEDGETGAEYNAIRAIDSDGTLIEPYYAKRHPVPFGEYVPWRGLLEIVFPPLTQISQLASDTAPGQESAVLDTAYGQVGSLICFDSIYEHTARDSVWDGAELLAVATNDSWFSDSAATRMHMAQAKLRAVETGRYVLRAACTGISGVISPTGETEHSLGALRQGILYADVMLLDDTTPYVRLGNVAVWLSLGWCVALCISCAVANRRVRAGLKG